MGRTFKPGISFYRMDCGHIVNKKVRLLFNEFKGDGYYIWHCILDYGYNKWGYYFDLNDCEELELFASEFCKMKLTTVNEVINGCIRRGLFDKTVADASKVLTSDMMQDTFLIATSERRYKGIVFDVREDLLLLDFTEEIPKNIAIVPPNNKIDRQKKAILPRKNTQIREEEIRGTEKKEEENEGASRSPAPMLVDRSAEESNTSTEESKITKRFVAPSFSDVKQRFIATAGNSKKNNPWPEDKCHNEAATFIAHYETNGWIQGQGRGRPIKNWKAACDQWIIRDREIVKAQPAPQSPAVTTSPPPALQMYPSPLQSLQKVQIDLNYLYERFLEDDTKLTEISIEWLTYDYLKRAGMIAFTKEQGDEIAEKVKEKYPDSIGDDFVKKMKKQGVIEFFKQLRSNGKTFVFNPNGK